MILRCNIEHTQIDSIIMSAHFFHTPSFLPALRPPIPASRALYTPEPLQLSFQPDFDRLDQMRTLAQSTPDALDKQDYLLCFGFSAHEVLCFLAFGRQPIHFQHGKPFCLCKRVGDLARACIAITYHATPHRCQPVPLRELHADLAGTVD